MINSINRSQQTVLFRSKVLTLLLSLMVCVAGCVSTNEVTLKPIPLETPDKLEPSVDSLYALSHLYIAHNEEEKSEAVLTYIVGKFPTFTPAYSDLAKIRIRQNQVDESIQLLEIAIGISDNDPILYNNLGLSQLLNAKYETAVISFETAQRINPRNDKYQANIALALGLMGNTQQSIAAYRKVISEEDA